MVKLVFSLAAASVIGLSSFFVGAPQDEKMQEDTTKFMMKKLDSSRSIISGLASEDYDEIDKAAQELSLLSRQADWNVISTESYLRMSNEFRESTSRLRKAAKEKNIDGATLAFFEVTLNCVRCHKYVRDEKKSK